MLASSLNPGRPLLAALTFVIAQLGMRCSLSIATHIRRIFFVVLWRGMAGAQNASIYPVTVQPIDVQTTKALHRPLHAE